MNDEKKVKSNQIMLKAQGALLRHQGTMADGSTKLCLYIGEMDDEQAIDLNNLIKNKAVDVIFLKSGMLTEIAEVISSSLEIVTMSQNEKKIVTEDDIFGKVFMSDEDFV